MMRVFVILACLLGGGVAAFYGQPLMRGNGDAIVVLITVLTVFAGFLVAIIAVLGDPSLVPRGSWRVAESRREALEARIIVHNWLFIFYLIGIGLLFLGVLVNEAPDELVSATCKMWIERLYLFFGVASFLLTFSLPLSLHRYQMGRVDAEIERRRLEARIDDGSRGS